MLTPNNIFSGSPRVTVIEGTYPAGRMNDESTEGALDGAYLTAPLMNDAWGFFQAAVAQSGQDFNESPETATASQILDGIKLITNEPRAPWIVAEVTADTPDTWAAAADSVNVDTITTPTGPGLTPGNLVVTAAVDGDGVLAHATPSTDLARTGLIVGADSGIQQVDVGASTAYGHRALIQWNGAAWVTLDDANPLVNSQDGGPTITAASTYIDVEFDDVNGMELNDLWFIQNYEQRPELDFTCARIAGKEGKAVRIYFIPRHPVRARISIDGSNIASLSAGSWNGIGVVSYNASTNILTINHLARKGPTHVTISTGGPSNPYVVKALSTSDTQTLVSLVGDAGVLQPMTSMALSFSKEVGGAENVEVQGNPTLAISNGVGVVAQDFAKVTGTLNITHVSNNV